MSEQYDEVLCHCGLGGDTPGRELAGYLKVMREESEAS